MSARTSLTMSSSHRRAMQAEVERCAPEEACGLLAGRGRRVEAVLPVTNALRSPLRFRMEPREQVRALVWIEAQGLELVGIYHSHPAGPAVPSPTDLEEFAYPGAVYLIWSPGQADWQARAFEIDAGRALEIDLIVVPDE